VSRTPGYPGLRTVPRFGSGTPDTTPGRPIHIGAGYRPHLTADGAGTAHIVYSLSGRASGPAGEETTTAGSDVYCRLPRGSRRCAATSTFTVPETYSSGAGDVSPYFENEPGFNTDIGEGARPLASGSSLLILMHRAHNVIQVPGGYSDDANFLYSSDDGGRSFTGPGIVGTLDYDSGAVIYGTGIQSIGVLGVTAATLADDPSHDHFQGVPAGSFAGAGTGAQLDPTYGSGDGRALALDGDRPVAAFSVVSGNSSVREYTGHGDVNDPANWSHASVRGTGLTLAGGPHGAWLAYNPVGVLKRAAVVRLRDGHPVGRAHPVLPRILDSQDDELTADANGGLTAAWVARDSGSSDFYGRLTITSSSDGVRWTKPQVIAVAPRHQTLSGLQIATAPDGGGFATYVRGTLNDGNPLGQAFGIGGQVYVVPFGPTRPTGEKGLGGLGGGGGGGCLDVRFGAVHAHVDAGCFLRDPSDPTGSAAIAYGGVHVNGVELRPDAPGTAIVVDPRTHTIDSVHGTVSVLLQSPGVPDIRLWDGSLHAYLGGHDHAGDLLFALPMGGFRANVLGFRALGTVDVLLGSDAVRIPLALALPRYMGATAAATLTADSAHDLDRASLVVSIPNLAFAGLDVSGTRLEWRGPAEQWAGTTELGIPPGAGPAGLDVRDASVQFDHGDFSAGSFVTRPYPGTPVYTDAYLKDFDAAFDLHPPRRITGDAELGAIPSLGSGYALEATGPFAIAFGTPSRMTVTGGGAIEGVPLSTARASFTTDGHFGETGSLGIDAFGIAVQGSVDASALLGPGTIAGTVTGSFSVEGQTLASKSVPFNSDGFGICEDSGLGPLHVSSGFVYHWSGSAEISLLDCDSLAEAGVSRARAADTGVPVAAGTDALELTVRGVSGAPSVVLRSPGGETVAPSLTDARAPAIALPLARGGVTLVAIRHPSAGLWHVDAGPGSPPIASVGAARGYPAPSVRARVAGHGRARRLIYRVGARPGLTVRFAEYRGGRPLAGLGGPLRGHGTIRFTPAAGPAGTRDVVALLSGLGTVPRSLVVARYRAPASPRPGRARLRLAVRGRRFVIRVGRSRAAARYLLRARTTAGRRIVALLRARPAAVGVPAAGWSDRIVVTVTPIGAGGRAGPTTRASLGTRFRAPRYARRVRRR
jgi:hypothetical protein